MSDVIHLPHNPIARDDRDRLESFGGHSIARGRATRWRWDRNADGDDVFEVFRSGKDEALVACISRNRAHDDFCATDGRGDSIAAGTLEHVLAELDKCLAALHDEQPDPAA